MPKIFKEKKFLNLCISNTYLKFGIKDRERLSECPYIRLKGGFNHHFLNCFNEEF